MKYLLKFLFIFILFSCQPVEVIQPVVFDNSQLPNISINAKSTKINLIYKPIFSEPYIGHSLINNPIKRINSWLENNINTFGNENILEINIFDASIKRFEEKDNEAKKFEEKDIYKYEIFYLVEFNLFNESNYLIASTMVETYRTTTSGRYISISETERIIDDIILDSLIDFTNESEKLVNMYMSDYII